VNPPFSASPSRRLLNSRAGAQIAHQARQRIDAEVDVSPRRIDVDARDEQVDDASLLGGEQLIPERVEPFERIAYFGLSKAIYCASRGAPSLDDDLRCSQKCSKCAGRPARSRWCKSTTMKE
jgi:hypothetical protein